MSEHTPNMPEPSLPESMALALARTAALDARGPSKVAVERAQGLSRLLPADAPGGWRAWFDRAAAIIATPIAPAPALSGVRRAVGPEALQWESPVARVEIEMERRVGVDGATTTMVQGQVEGSGNLAEQPCPIAALAEDGSLMACTVMERNGYFTLETKGAIGYLALALPGGTLILDPPAPRSATAAGEGSGKE